MEETLLGQTEQMPMNCGLNIFDGAGVGGVHKEMKQLHNRRVPIPADANKFPYGSNSAAITYQMFLNMKQGGTVKGQGCADGRKQSAYINNNYSSSPNVDTKSLFISCTIDNKDHHKVATVEISGAFLKAYMDELLHVRFEGIMVELLNKINPTLYSKYVVK